MLKKFLNLLLYTVVFLSFVIIIKVNADTVNYPVTGGNIIFDISTGAITGYTGYPTEVEIPIKINDVEVISICGFSNCITLKSVSIPQGVIFIEDSTFYGCKGLTSIIIPTGITNINKNSFAYCDYLTSVIIPDGITNIQNGAFYGCIRLKDILIPDSVTFIGDRAFNNCLSLNSVVIPRYVKNIGSYAFYGCNSMKTVTITNSSVIIGSNAFTNKNLIYCFVGSNAEIYATKNNIPYTTIRYTLNLNSIEYNSSNITVIYTIGNTTISNTIGIIAFVIYNTDNKIIKTIIKNISLTANSTNEVFQQTINYPLSKGYKVKVFLWNNVLNITPLTEPCEKVIE